MSSDIEKTAKLWSEYTAKSSEKKLGVSWWEAGPEICNRINRNISGDPNCDYTTYTLNKYFVERIPLEYCLSLGCGSGGLERSLARQNAFNICDAYDVAEGSIKLAKKFAQDDGYDNINYNIADINNIILPLSIYDAVWIQGAMHHFESLEHVCEQILQSLKPNGLLILNEYIGPSRFQFPTRQKEVANLCLRLLPLKYRAETPEAVANELERSPIKQGAKWLITRLIDKINDRDLLNVIKHRLRKYYGKRTGKIIEKSEISFPSTRDVIAADPSEAVRSDEILSVIQQYFEIIEMKDLGGNILQFLLSNIAGNFTEEDQLSQALLRMVMTIEETLLYCDEFKSDFAYIVARPLRK